MARSPVYETRPTSGSASARSCSTRRAAVGPAQVQRHRRDDRSPVAQLIVANHISHLDPLYDAVFVRKSGRIPHIMAKAVAVEGPGARQRVGRYGPDPRRSKWRPEPARPASMPRPRALAEGRVVLIYPEGSVTKEPGLLADEAQARCGRAGPFRRLPGDSRWRTGEPSRSTTPTRRRGSSSRCPARTSTSSPVHRSTCPPWRGKPVDARAIRDVSLPDHEHHPGHARRVAGRSAAGRSCSIPRRPPGSRTRQPTPQPRQLRGRPEPAPWTSSKPATDASTAADARPARRRRRDSRRTWPNRGRRPQRIAVLGAGSWGTTFAKVLVDAGRDVVLWARRDGVARSINGDRVNPDYLPGIELPAACGPPPTSTRRLPARRRSRLRCPASRCGRTSWCSGTILPARGPVVSLAKGIEVGTGLRMSELIAGVGTDRPGPGRRAHRPEPGRGDRRRPADRHGAGLSRPCRRGRRSSMPAARRTSGRTPSPTSSARRSPAPARTSSRWPAASPTGSGWA